MKRAPVFVLLLVTFVAMTRGSADCRWQTQNETEDSFLLFMDKLEDYTFNRKAVCENGTELEAPEIEDTIWDERFHLYDGHMSLTRDCLCIDEEGEFQTCMAAVRQSMTTRVLELIADIEILTADIINNRCTN